jgi:hypothetical protein
VLSVRGVKSVGRPVSLVYEDWVRYISGLRCYKKDARELYEEFHPEEK